VRAGELLERTGLAESSGKKVKELSKGMGQIVQLIVTVIHDPELIILDEPFSGLDPVNTELLRTIVAEHRDRGKAIILSTHQMNQVEEICDRVLMIDHGKAVLYGDLTETTARFRRRSVLVEIEGELPELPGVTEVKRDGEALELVPAADVTPMMLLDQLRERNLVINRFEIATPSLHEIFLKVVGGNDE
jgi:ABC-2 type transport system ATP-binding protein